MKGFKTLCLFPKNFLNHKHYLTLHVQEYDFGDGVTLLSLSVTVYVIDGQNCLLVQKINKNLELMNKS